MEVKNSQQNLGFGVLNVKVDGKKIGKEAVKQIEKLAERPDEFRLTHYSADGNVNKMVMSVHSSKDNEIQLAQKLRELGAKVVRTVKTMTTIDATNKNIKWVNKN